MKHHRARTPFRTLSQVVGLGLAVQTIAWAQAAPGTAPSQVTPPTLRPPAPSPFRATPIPIPATADNTAPAGAEALFVMPSGYAFASDSAELAAVARRFTLPPPRARISVADLFSLAARLEQALVQAGYPLARVALPAQAVADGEAVNFVVVDGFIESVDVQALPAAARDVVRRRTAALVGQRGLRIEALERHLLLAAEVPGLALRSTLARGRQHGGSQLILQGNHSPVSGSISTDNRLNETLRRWQFGPSVSLNSLLGAGEQLYASLRSGSQVRDTFGTQPLLRTLAAGALLPVGSDGATLSAEYTDSLTHADTTPGVIDTRGHLRRASLRGALALQRSRSATLTAGLALESLQQTSEALLFAVAISEDRYTALRATLDGSGLTDDGTRIDAGLTLSRGLGGRDAGDASRSGVTLSRQGSSPRFSKLGLTLQWSQALPLARSSLDFFASAQSAFGQALMQSEQMLLDGGTLVSGLPSGALAVDAGVALRLEARHRLAIDLQSLSGQPLAVTPYGFIAHGQGRVEQPTTLEKGRVVGRSYGLGLRAETGDFSRALRHSLALEVARQRSDAPGLQQNSRATLQYSLAF